MIIIFYIIVFFNLKCYQYLYSCNTSCLLFIFNIIMPELLGHIICGHIFTMNLKLVQFFNVIYRLFTLLKYELHSIKVSICLYSVSLFIHVNLKHSLSIIYFGNMLIILCVSNGNRYLNSIK